MQLPINSPDLNFDDEKSDDAIWWLVREVKEASGGLAIKHVRLSQTTKKLLIRFQDGTSRQDLEKIKVLFFFTHTNPIHALFVT